MYEAVKTIKIKDEEADPNEIKVLPRAVIQFTNLDANDYVIFFFINGDDPKNPGARHPDVDLYLPAHDTRPMIAGLNLDKGECKFKIVKVAANSIGVKERCDDGNSEIREARNKSAGGKGGGGTIHIGS